MRRVTGSRQHCVYVRGGGTMWALQQCLCQLAVREERERKSAGGYRVSILRKMSIESRREKSLCPMQICVEATFVLKATTRNVQILLILEVSMDKSGCVSCLIITKYCVKMKLSV